MGNGTEVGPEIARYQIGTATLSFHAPKLSPAEKFLHQVAFAIKEFAWKVDCRDRNRRAQNGNAESGVVQFLTDKRDPWNDIRKIDIEFFAPTREELGPIVAAYEAKYVDYQVRLGWGVTEQFDGFVRHAERLEERVQRAA